MRLFRFALVAIVFSVLCVFCGPGGAVAQPNDGQLPDWVAAMREVHAHSEGRPGVVLQLGDSITYSLAFFAPLQYTDDAKVPPEAEAALRVLDAYIAEECYRWKGGDKGNYSGQTAGWAARNVDRWIDSLRPELAIVMFGTNDIRQGSIDKHEENLRALISRCLDAGVVVILTTIPPMHGHEERVRETVEVQRRLAGELRVPLIDYYAHIMNRRPTDWDGRLPQFAEYGQWEVPTLISRDGVHPSNPSRWRNDYSAEGQMHSGYVLRNYLTLIACAEVIQTVFQGENPSGISQTILGAKPPKPANLPPAQFPEPASE